MRKTSPASAPGLRRWGFLRTAARSPSTKRNWKVAGSNPVRAISLRNEHYDLAALDPALPIQSTEWPFHILNAFPFLYAMQVQSFLQA